MKLAIMQPYFCPYLGYFQLIHSVDKFILYDNIEFSKKGWFVKNQFLLNGKAKGFSIPIKKDSDYLYVNQRQLADNSQKEAQKILSQIENAYRKAPHFKEVFPFLKDMFLFEDKSLFAFIQNANMTWCRMLDIQTEIVVSSSIPIDYQLKGTDKVLALCEYYDSQTYINAPGGRSQYDRETFSKKGIELHFIEPHLKPYPQFSDEFIPNLSIIDVVMFNGIKKTKELLTSYSID